MRNHTQPGSAWGLEDGRYHWHISASMGGGRKLPCYQIVQVIPWQLPQESWIGTCTSVTCCRSKNHLICSALAACSPPSVNSQVDWMMLKRVERASPLGGPRVHIPTPFLCMLQASISCCTRKFQQVQVLGARCVRRWFLLLESLVSIMHCVAPKLTLAKSVPRVGEPGA